MIFHENRLLADDSHEISYLIFSKIGKDVSKFVVCCSCDWHTHIDQNQNVLQIWDTGEGVGEAGVLLNTGV